MLTLLVWVLFLVESWFVWDRWPEDQPHVGMWALILLLFLIATIWSKGLKS